LHVKDPENYLRAYYPERYLTKGENKMNKTELIEKLKDLDDDGIITIYSIEAKEDEMCIDIPILEVAVNRKELEIFIEI